MRGGESTVRAPELQSSQGVAGFVFNSAIFNSAINLNPAGSAVFPARDTTR